MRTTFRTAGCPSATGGTLVRSLVRTLAILMAVLLGSCANRPGSQPPPPAAPSLPQSGSGGAQSSLPKSGAGAQTALAEGSSRGLEQGHSATVDCLHGERAQTDGNELRCEDWTYVQQNYLQAR
ncbi:MULTISPECIES: hypothetical protein [Aphanothece]|uniref:hypothetical protein n=1 Tax=Aphanothece TaxID=1121 RepID=UPI003984D971